WRMLASFRAVKHHPHHKIVAEVFEPVNLSCSREQRVARSKPQPLPFDDKPAVSGDHHVELVAGMRFLRICVLGRVDLYLQGAVLELQSKSFAVFGGDGLASIAEFDLSGGGELHFSAHHLSLMFDLSFPTPSSKGGSCADAEDRFFI